MDASLSVQIPKQIPIKYGDKIQLAVSGVMCWLPSSGRVLEEAYSFGRGRGKLR